MTKPSRILLRLCSAVLAVLLLGSGFAWQQWTAFKRELGIVRLDWDGLRLSPSGLSVRLLSYEQATTEGLHLTLQADDASLQFSGLLRPLPARSLHVARLELNVQSLPQKAERQPSPPVLDSYRQSIAWLPQQLNIADLQLTLPCASGHCDERGALQLRHAGDSLLPLDGRLDLNHNEHQLSLIIAAQRPDVAGSLVEATLLIDGQPRMETRSRLDSSADALQWSGTLSMGSLPEAPWLLDWLAEWSNRASPALPDMPSDMRLGAGWALSWPPVQEATFDWRDSTGELRLSALLPVPWPVIGLGELQGEFDLAAHGRNGVWLPSELNAALKLKPAPTLLASVPTQLHPTQLHIGIEPIDAERSSGHLPVQLKLDAEGDSTLTLLARLQLTTTPPYALGIEQAQLQLQGSELQLDGLSLQGLDAELGFSGQIDLERIELQLLESSHIALARASSGELAASQLRVDLPEPLHLQVENHRMRPTFWRARGKAALRLGRLAHPQLLAQGWRWSAELDADATHASGSGPLSNDAGLALDLDLEKRWSGPLQVNGKLQEIFLRAGNPLAGSLTAWPASLELNSGRLQGSGNLTLPEGANVVSARLTLEARGLAGIFDRAELAGLDAHLAANLERNRLQVDLAEVRLAQLNPGFTIGPLRLQGQYQANIEQPTRGRVSWIASETEIFGGRFWLQPSEIDLSAPSQKLSARLQGLQLDELLNAYPTEGLSGDGILDGRFDIQRSARGLSVNQGQLAAREPGVLRFRSPKIEALGQSNPAMKLVTEALHDFHYDLLSSDVRYDERGKLNLGLRLNGRNPALEGGRPINFSINLEEDIPALLTSLQLSDRVSETIQRRVQERLQ